MHPLDNVIWRALTTRQTGFAESFGDARRFLPEVGPLAASLESWETDRESFEGLVAPGGTIAVFPDSPYRPSRGWSVVATAPLLQMVRQDGGLGEHDSAAAFPPAVELGAADSAEMRELAALTKPGPFGPRTRELGSFFGIRRNGKLAAMAGERMKVPGFTEVSAVCTHPEHAGHGYAAAAMLRVMRGILERGETPFLHVRQDNARAIELYRRLGFRERWLGRFELLRRE
jgi:ribosomal protein S18 acetylase RimI-like enzyme